MALFYLCQAGDGSSLIMGHGALAPLAFPVPILKTSYEIQFKASPASSFTWYFKLSGRTPGHDTR